MDRRSFLQQVSAWSVGASVAPPVFKIVPEALAAEAASPLVAVAEGKDYEALVGAVLRPLGGMGAFVKRGQNVVIKPNIAWDRKPELAANTHPVVVTALIKAALDAGASRVTVFDRPCNEMRLTYANSGILAAVQALDDKRVRCDYIDDRKFVPVKVEKGKEITEWQFYKDALEADCYINVPIAKHHRLAKLTIGLKNVMGVLGGKRGALHDSIGQKIADMNTVVRPQLTVVDATRILLRNGPMGGNPEDVATPHTLVASADTVAADAYVTKSLFDLAPGDMPITAAAAGLGLGEMDLSRIQVVKV